MNPQKSNDFNSQAEENRKQSNSLKVLTVLVVILVIAIGFSHLLQHAIKK
jgi:hypothetical protein